MSRAKLVALLVVSGAALGCGSPCERVATQAIALDKDCAAVALKNGDARLAVACGQGYVQIAGALAGGSCSSSVGVK